MSQTQDDPIAVLEAGQQALREQFSAYRQLCAQSAPAQRRRTLAEQACLGLAIQSRLEDELVYPRLCEAAPGEPALVVAHDEHAGARARMCQVLLADPAQPGYDAQVQALAEYVDRHILRERAVLFPRLQRSLSGEAARALAGLLRERRSELEAVREALREEALVTTLAA